MKIKDLPILERPREKAYINGIESLSNPELLAIIIRNGYKNMSALDLAYQILQKYQSIEELFNVSIHDLMNFPGISRVKALSIIAAINLSRRVNKFYKEKRIILNTSKLVYDLLSAELKSECQEVFIGLFLDSKCGLIKKKLIFKGSVANSHIHPRDLFREAYSCNASRLIIVHNHPSGNVEPSESDIQVTKDLLTISKIMALPIIDHIIIGDQSYFSFYENKILD